MRLHDGCHYPLERTIARYLVDAVSLEAFRRILTFRPPSSKYGIDFPESANSCLFYLKLSGQGRHS
jgi:hypothetical protein